MLHLQARKPSRGIQCGRKLPHEQYNPIHHNIDLGIVLLPDVVSRGNEYLERGEFLDNLRQLKELVECYDQCGEASQLVDVVGKVG